MERVKTFVNGGREYPADLNAIQDRAAELLEGLASAIPSSHFAGRYYRATDTGDLYLDNGTAWEKIAGKEAIKEANLGPESVSVAKIKAEAVTDAKVVKGRALVETENNYSALTERAEGTEFEVSSSRPALVILTIDLEKASGSAKVFVGAVEISNPSIGVTTGVLTNNIPITFKVMPGKKWKWTSELGAPKAFSSYLIE